MRKRKNNVVMNGKHGAQQDCKVKEHLKSSGCASHPAPSILQRGKAVTSPVTKVTQRAAASETILLYKSND